jgi:hypothetical protein
MIILATATMMVRYLPSDLVDQRLPHDFVPFNVQAIGKDIVVTYVLHQEGSPPLKTDVGAFFR